jgi:ribonuclease P protein component
LNARFPKSVRILKPQAFRTIQDHGVVCADGVLVIKVTLASGQPTRLGLAIGRPVGNAVVRNRWKRLIREAFRQNRDQLPVGLQMVVRPKKGAEPKFQAIGESLRKLGRLALRRIGQS